MWTAEEEGAALVLVEDVDQRILAFFTSAKPSVFAFSEFVGFGAAVLQVVRLSRSRRVYLLWSTGLIGIR